MIADRMDMLRKKFTEDARTIDDMIDLVTQALRNQGPSGWMERLSSLETRANQFELELDFFCTSIISLYSPEARDLRTVLMVLKMNTEIERVADLLYGIGKSLRDLESRGGRFDDPTIIQLFLDSTGMYRDAISAFSTDDAGLARKVLEKDDLIDAERHRIISSYLEGSAVKASIPVVNFDHIKITQKIERIADHSTNLCEEVIFMIEGKNVKHHNVD